MKSPKMKLDKTMKPYTKEQKMAKMKHEQGESAKKRVMEAGTANGGRMSYSTSRKSC